MIPSQVTIAELYEQCPVVDATTLCEGVDHELGGSWQGSSALVRAADGSLGLLGKTVFLARMAGRYGYGRSLWGKRPIAALATWGLPMLRPTMTTVEAAALIVDGEEGYGYRDLPVVDSEGLPLGIVRPVRIMKALAEQTAHRAATDELTGVASRARFIEELERRLGDLADGPGAVVVVFLDLDRLKPVNDLFGHTLGDALLRSVAKRLRRAVGHAGLLGRIGGDEFAVVASLDASAPSPLEASALAIGERLRAALAQPDPELPRQAESRASIGVAVTTAGTETSGALLTAADEAMYAAKMAGGDRVRLAGTSPTRFGELPTADLELVYQPVVDVRNGSVVAVEALLRARGADGCLEFPAARMQQISRAGAALELDRWVLAQACAAMVKWTGSHPDSVPPRINVNLAPDSVSRPDLAEVVLEAVEASGLPPHRVCLELSEYVGVDDLVAATPALTALAASGIQLALDDMGATLGALRMIGTALPIECVKVDRSGLLNVLVTV